MAKPQITYFDIRGRAEPIRLMLEERGIAYDDVYVDDKWEEIKPTTPFGQLPCYRAGDREDDLELYQSAAIFRHLARIHELYGETEMEHVRCDLVCEAFRDAKDHLGFAFWRPNFDEKAFANDEIPPRLAPLEKIQGGQRDFWVGSAPSLADMVAFAYLDDVALLFPDRLLRRRDSPRSASRSRRDPGCARTSSPGGVQPQSSTARAVRSIPQTCDDPGHPSRA